MGERKGGRTRGRGGEFAAVEAAGEEHGAETEHGEKGESGE